jgi:hypothetical protein
MAPAQQPHSPPTAHPAENYLQLRPPQPRYQGKLLRLLLLLRLLAICRQQRGATLQHPCA